MNSLFDELYQIASKRSKHTRKPICRCNTVDSEGEIGIISDSSGSKFFVCPACDPRLECTLCNQTGHRFFLETYKNQLADGTEISFTVQNTQPNACICMNAHKIVDLLNHAEIPERYIKAKFTSCQFSHLSDEQSKILKQNIGRIKLFCETIYENQQSKNRKYFLILFGCVGSGKTLLATAALKYLISMYKISGKFIDFQYLLSLIKAQFEENKTGESLLASYRSTDILVIDEFAKGRLDKEWPLEMLDDLVNYRYNHKKITVITTNYLPHQHSYNQEQKTIHESFWKKTLPERIGERMYDRLIEVSEFVDFTIIPSYRKHIAESKLLKQNIIFAENEKY